MREDRFSKPEPEIDKNILQAAIAATLMNEDKIRDIAVENGILFEEPYSTALMLAFTEGFFVSRELYLEVVADMNQN